MARKPRLHYPGAFYHIILRGNDGQDIFYNSNDRLRIYLLIQEGIERYRHRIHAFCLMTNHLHMVVQVRDISLAKIIQNVSFRYTRYINKRKKRVGHLFQGRYKAILIDADSYLLELVRYIHNNPLRAGLVKMPEQHQWSSHRAYLGKENIEWLTTDFVLAQFAENESKARLQFHDFCLKGASEESRDEFHKGTFEGRILGDDDFSERAVSRAKEWYDAPVRIDRLASDLSRVFRISTQTLTAPGKHQPGAEARALMAYLVLEAGKPSLTELGNYLQRDPTTLSKSASRIRERLKDERELRAKLEKVKAGLRRK